MATIEIPDALFARLQKLAEPLVDTPATVIQRLLNRHEAETGERDGTAVAGRPGPRENQRAADLGESEPGKVPSLRHTRILEAKFAGRKADGWNSLVHVAHIEAVKRLGSVESVRRISSAKLMAGNANSDRARAGFRYVAEINACIQNVDANHAWSNTFRLAKALKVAVEVELEWLDKREAAYPGKTARLLWKPKDEASTTKQPRPLAPTRKENPPRQ